MSGLVVDTSVWIEFFKDKSLPHLEEALKSSQVVISSMIVAELLSGKIPAKQEKELIEFLQDLNPLHPDTEHWIRVGQLRRLVLSKGISISTPDAHIAQCALDLEARLYTFDKIFEKLVKITGLKLIFD